MAEGRRYHSLGRRGAYAFAIVAGLVLVGTIGIHRIEGMSYLDAFYFVSMIATAQGPAIIPHTPGGKIFAALLSFIAVGTVVAALGYLFGPFFRWAWASSIHKLEEEEHVFEEKLRKRR